MVSEPVKPYFTRLLRVLTFYLEASNGVVFCGNGVVNGVVEWYTVDRIRRMRSCINKVIKNMSWHKREDLIKLMYRFLSNKKC